MLTLALGMAAGLSGPAAEAAAPKSAVYCVKVRGDLSQFAGKVQPDGTLLFGISLWQSGQNIGVTGLALKRGEHWEYERQVTAGTPDTGCRIVILLRPTGTTRVIGDRAANCHSDDNTKDPDGAVGSFSGGAGTKIDVDFPRKAYRGPVTVELDDLREFFEEPAGLLNKPNC